MAYIGIGYSGDDQEFLTDFVERNLQWLQGDRQPKFFGKSFVVFYDSNTAREFIKKCLAATSADTISIYPMEKPLDYKQMQKP